MKRNGNLANFFSYVCNGKKIKELFASTLNRKPVSVRCVSSMMIVLSARFILLVAHANKKACERRVLLVKKTLTFNFYCSLHCARKNESIIYFPTIYANLW